ncbi:hypothetical protein ACFL0L_01690 [Patescibacteria group bacterium]
MFERIIVVAVVLVLLLLSLSASPKKTSAAFNPETVFVEFSTRADYYIGLFDSLDASDASKEWREYLFHEYVMRLANEQRHSTDNLGPGWSMFRVPATVNEHCEKIQVGKKTIWVRKESDDLYVFFVFYPRGHGLSDFYVHVLKKMPFDSPGSNSDPTEYSGNGHQLKRRDNSVNDSETSVSFYELRIGTTHHNGDVPVWFDGSGWIHVISMPKN